MHYEIMYITCQFLHVLHGNIKFDISCSCSLICKSNLISNIKASYNALSRVQAKTH